MLRCLVCHNDEMIKTYEISESAISIGRLPENTISIANMGVSRRHVRIDKDVSRNYILTDLGSLNGTFLNNKKVKKATLSSGDKITIGKYTIVIEAIINDEPSGSVPASPAVMAEPVAPRGVDNPRQAPAPTSTAMPQLNSAGSGAPRGGPVLIDTSKHAVYPLEKRVMSMGASESDDIIISGFMISDAHLIIEKLDDGIWINSGKKAGRFKVNGKKTASHQLKNKDRLEIGNCVFAFMENG